MKSSRKCIKCGCDGKLGKLTPEKMNEKGALRLLDAIIGVNEPSDAEIYHMIERIMKGKHSEDIPERVIRKGKATVFFWSDGTKTVVRLMEDEEDCLYSAWAIACTKRRFGSATAMQKAFAETEAVTECFDEE